MYNMVRYERRLKGQNAAKERLHRVQKAKAARWAQATHRKHGGDSRCERGTTRTPKHCNPAELNRIVAATRRVTLHAARASPAISET